MYGSTQANLYISHNNNVKLDAKTRFTGDVSQKASINDYVLGSFYYLTSDSSVTTSLGQIYVDYEIELTVPQPSNYYEAELDDSTAYYRQLVTS